MSDPMKPSPPRPSLAGRFFAWVVVAGMTSVIILGVVWLAKAVLWS